jgi:tetratricopeptide (TPR) repeat protein/peroxiredoxin
LLVASLSLPAGALAAAGRVVPPRSPGQPFLFRPQLAPSESLQPFLDEITPGSDLFPDERVAEELIALLKKLGATLKESPDRAGSVAELLLAPSFRGGRLRPIEETAITRTPSLQILRARVMSQDPVLDSRSFARELRLLLEGFRQVTVAEFLVTSLQLRKEEALATTDVRYDFVGPGKDAARVERLGVWKLRWRRAESGWRVVEWTAAEDLRSSASRPAFSEVTAAALGGNDSFRRQLAIGFDAWVATLDSGFARDSNGHHGISVGDADGDGRDDIYVAQPYGFPNRLYRALGDGTFEDITDRAGVGILEDTQHSLFADVDNDGDQDLIVVISSGPALFVNEGRGRFVREPGAFHFEKGLQGAPMSMAVADYDRDGFLDVYLSVYSYHYGAGEGKAGTPTPYHDAVNGPPNVLFRNDGHGSFVEVTREVGLDAGNDRFSFSAAWGDYDNDGWPDLVVTNDFGRKNLYHNLGLRDGKVRFEDVAAKAGVEDHAAGMSILFFDFDGDGRLDIYGGQMWSDSGVRVTASPNFMPDAPPEVHALYRHHAQGNSLFRNRGDGTFEDVTLPARANMGRWSWSTGALDFDCDGWEDLYAVNGMVTREASSEDLDWMFWGGVVARSPLMQATGTPYDDAWRALNRLMVEHSVAGHQRNVFLRNDGRGRLDDVSGAVGLDLDQDGRAFSVLDFDGDGDPDLVLLAPRSAPQVRLFRNDFEERGATLAVRLVGKPDSPFAETGAAIPPPAEVGQGSGRASSRDAIGARVIVETDRLRRMKEVHAGSGFLSQHSKELLFGLGASERVVRLTVEWPSGRRQVFTEIPLNQRLRIEEGGEPQPEPYAALPKLATDVAPPAPSSPPGATWLYEPFPAPDFSLKDLRGEDRSLSALQGRPAVVLLWATEADPSRTALLALGAGGEALAQAGVGAVALALDAPEDVAKVGAAASGVTTVPVIVASEEIAIGYAILNRHLFMNRQDLQLPTTFLLDAQGRIVRVYRERVDIPQILRDAPAIEAAPAQRLARALPFDGAFSVAPSRRDYVPYGRDLLDQGLEAQAVVAFEQAARASPSASSLYRLGNLLVKTGQTAKAKAAYERALELQPDLSEAANDLGTLLAEGGDIPAAIERFRAALATAPDYPDALNNLGYALLLSGRAQEARENYERALALQPDFPEALNNLGLILGRQGDMEGAEPYFRKALEKRGGYGEAANNLALVLVNRGQLDAAIGLLQGFIEKNPESESSYITLAKILLSADRRQEGLAILDRLLKRNPTHAVALDIARRFR